MTLHQLRALVTRAMSKTMGCMEKDTNAVFAARLAVEIADELHAAGVVIPPYRPRPRAGEEEAVGWWAESEKGEVS